MSEEAKKVLFGQTAQSVAKESDVRR